MVFLDILLKPQGAYRPSKEDVFTVLEKVMKVNLEEFIAAPVEYFTCHNGEVKIYGEHHLVAQAKGIVIMAHGFAQNRYILIPQEQIFRKLGFSTILFDQRAFGESEETVCTFGMEESKDIKILTDYVRQHIDASLPIILFGVSMGAATVMNALEHTDDVYAVIEDCGFSSFKEVVPTLFQSFGLGQWHEEEERVLAMVTKKLGFTWADHNPYNVIKKSKVPICIFHGTKDPVIPVAHGQRIYEASVHKDSLLALFEGKEHALCILEEERYEQVLRQFFKELL